MEGGRYTLEQFEAALAGVEEKRPSKKGAGDHGTASRLDLDHRRLVASRPELVIEAIEVWPNDAETNPTHLDFVRAMAAIKAALGPKREDYYGDVLKWALGYPENDGKYVRSVWDSIRDAEVGADWLFRQARPYGFVGDVQEIFADPAYPPESFYNLDADGIRARIDELVILKFGWPDAYEEVRAHLEIYSIIDLAELDALIAERAPAYNVATENESTPTANKEIKANPFTWQDPKSIPPREWLYGRHYMRKHVGATIAPSGVGKSATVIVEALAMVTGKNLLKDGDPPASPLRVWYINLEDPPDELQRRIAAVCLHYGISPEDMGDRLFVNSGRETEIVIAREDRGGLKIAEPVVDALRREIRDKQIDVVIIDPFVASHGVSENDNVKINAVLGQWRMLADVNRCAVELVHHTRKPSFGQGEYSVDDARGASAMIAAARSARTLNVMTKEEAKKARVAEHQRRSFFRVDNGKATHAPPAEKSTWRRLISVQLGNGASIAHAGDSVGVVTPWEYPDPSEEVSPDDVRAVQEAVASGEWRDDVRSKNWVGYAIMEALELDKAEPSARETAKALQRLWTKDGTLKVVERQDAKRMKRNFVEVGKKKVAA